MPEIPELRVLNPGIGKIGRDRGIAIPTCHSASAILIQEIVPLQNKDNNCKNLWDQLPWRRFVVSVCFQLRR